MSKEINKVIWIGVGALKTTKQNAVMLNNNNTICSYYMPGSMLQESANVTSVNPQNNILVLVPPVYIREN